MCKQDGKARILRAVKSEFQLCPHKRHDYVCSWKANRLARILARIRREQRDKYVNAGKPVPMNLETRKIGYGKLAESEQNEYHMLLLLGSALFNTAKVNILNKNGLVTRESAKTIRKMSELLEVA